VRAILEVGLFAATLLLVLFSSLAVSHKSMIYSALFLALLGLTNASLFFALGFAIVAFVQVVVYVGASVLFLIVSISMLREPASRFVAPRYGLLGLAGVVVFGSLLAYFFGTSANVYPHLISYGSIALQLVELGHYGVVLLFLLLLVALVSSITVATGDKK